MSDILQRLQDAQLRGELPQTPLIVELIDAIGNTVIELPEQKPKIVCLCGSTRFAEEFRLQNLRLTLEGKIVLSIGYDGKSDADLDSADWFGLKPDKVKLDELHKRKIDLADNIFVLNVGGYIGESTRSEIEYSIKHGKPISYLEYNVAEGALERST